MNKLNFNFEVKTKKNGSIVVAGFANAATIDRAEEIIDPKAWRLDNYKKNPIVLFDHGMDLAFGSLPVGKAIKVEPRENGLYCEVEISNSKTEKITAVRDLVEEGILKTFSVGFDPKNSAKEENVKRITDAELLEISFVPIPMNQDSTFSMLSKSLSDQRTKTARRWWENYKKNVQREIVSAVKNNSACDKLELLSLVVKKDGFDSLEKAKKFLVEKKYLVEKIDEDDNCWKFIQKHADNVETIDIDLTPSIKAIIKGKKMKEEEKPDVSEEEKMPGENDDGKACDDKPKQKADDMMMQKEDVDSAIAEMQAEASACANNEEGNPAAWVGDEAAWNRAKDAADQSYSREDPEKYWAVVTWLYLNRFGGTVKQPEKSEENADSKGANDPETKNVIPTGGDAVQETVNPQIDLSKQTNVLLGVVIDQLQKINMSMEKMVEVPRRVDEEPEQQQETEQENMQENRQEEPEENDEEMKKAIRLIRANQEDLNLRLKSLIY